MRDNNSDRRYAVVIYDTTRMDGCIPIVATLWEVTEEDAVVLDRESEAS